MQIKELSARYLCVVFEPLYPVQKVPNMVITAPIDQYVCDVCGWEYDEEKGYPEGGIAPGTKWEDIPDDFECPLCSVGKDQFSVAE